MFGLLTARLTDAVQVVDTFVRTAPKLPLNLLRQSPRLSEPAFYPLNYESVCTEYLKIQKFPVVGARRVLRGALQGGGRR